MRHTNPGLRTRRRLQTLPHSPLLPPPLRASAAKSLAYHTTTHSTNLSLNRFRRHEGLPDPQKRLPSRYHQQKAALRNQILPQRVGKSTLQKGITSQLQGAPQEKKPSGKGEGLPYEANCNIIGLRQHLGGCAGFDGMREAGDKMTTP